MCEICGTTIYIKVERCLKPLFMPLTPEQEVLDNLPYEYLPFPTRCCPVCGTKMKESKLDIVQEWSDAYPEKIR